MNKKIHVIHHTHWDLEWFFTVEDSTTLLQHQLENVAKNIEKQKIPYLFDAQVGVFEKLLKDEYYQNLIKKSCKNGKLLFGPWYSQPDMRITNGESIIRNLEYGKNIAEKYGSHFNTLYTPDSFGFAFDFSQLYTDLGHEWTVLWRGVDRKAIKNAPIFKWGTKDKYIKVYNIASGYFVGRFLFDDENFEKIFNTNIAPSIEYQSWNNKYKNIAIPFGGDQMPFSENLIKVVERLNAKNDGNEYVISTWSDFLKAISEEIKDDELPLYEDSLSLANGGRLHKTISSTRIDIKQKIFALEIKLAKILEPLYTLINSNMKYPHILFDEAWKKLFLAQAHDSYGGCNSDEVNANIKNRVIRANNIVDSNIDLAINLIGRNNPGKLTIVNPLPTMGDGFFKAKIATDYKNFELVHENEKIDYLITNSEKKDGGFKVFYTASGENQTKLPDYYLFDIIFKLNNFKNNHASLIEVKKATSQIKKETKIEKLNFDLKYLINILPDAGDGYDWSPLTKKDKKIIVKHSNFKKAKLLEMNNFKKYVLEYSQLIPSSLEGWKNNKASKFKLDFIVEIIKYSNDYIFNVQFKKLCGDIRIDLEFIQKEIIESYKVKTQLGISKKNSQFDFNQNWKEDKYHDMPIKNDVFEGMVLLGNDSNYKAFITESTREHYCEGKNLSFVLLRTAQFLGRPDLITRPGRQSGIPDLSVATPDAFLELDNINFEFTIFNEVSSIKQANILQEISFLRNLPYHAGTRYKHMTRMDIWNHQYINAKDNVNKIYNLKNNSFTQQALYKNRKNEIILRIVNPMMDDQKLEIDFNDKVILKSGKEHIGKNIKSKSIIKFVLELNN